MRVSRGLPLLTAIVAGGVLVAPAAASPGPTDTTRVAIASVAKRDATATAGAATRSLAVKRHIHTRRWGTGALRKGNFAHTRFHEGIRIGRRPVRVSYDDPYGGGGARSYQRGRWFSPWVRPGFGLEELIASWNARTPRGTFIEVAARGRTMNGRRSSWDTLGRWASHDHKFHRMSLGAQRDDFSRVAVDTLVTQGRAHYRAWQLRVSLFRRTGSGRTPTVTMMAAMASRLPATSPTSRTGVSRRVVVPVPRYSQMIHEGEYPQWDGGGEAWCSPTSVSMVLASWDRGPTPKQYAWVNDSYRDPWVDYAARYTFAWGYDGAGDWPFNTAYAARFRTDAFVTRLRSLREAELFVRKGIPLVASIAFGPGELTGSPLTSTGGHLLVIRGFTARGNVIVNDPAGANRRQVKRVYKRGQFENAWLDQTGGVVYVIHPPGRSLPAPARHSNW